MVTGASEGVELTVLLPNSPGARRDAELAFSPRHAASTCAAIGATIRQTRLGVSITESDVLGGDFSGEVDVDFFGGQQPSSGGRTFPLLRLRRAFATVTWQNVRPAIHLPFGQESLPLPLDVRRFLMLLAPAVSLLGTVDLMSWSLQAFFYRRIRIRYPHDDFVLLSLAAHRRLR